jgi:hypothetical protein
MLTIFQFERIDEIDLEDYSTSVFALFFVRIQRWDSCQKLMG